ncbi:metal-binding protein ZinT [Entomohabitans teleogrylli]|uniref:metal-binding protein ZinT n=1 Tax=Entomohabitans teleogrylli TaxID=1384589 RepID=UPI00073D2D46|nr:metal-binding protein ZinT [Entomohabitans teleogrylli]
MIRKISGVVFSAGMLFTSTAAFAHSHHDHGVPMSEMERQASEGVFDDANVKARSLSDWDGVWQSINPWLLDGTLDPVLRQKAKKGDKTVEQYRAYYKTGYATDIDMIGIENNVIEFHTGKTVAACDYTYSGFKILHYASGKKGVRYLFECSDKNSQAPKYVQFSDHIIAPRQSQHFHIYMGNQSQDALLKEMENWPTFYPYSLSKDQIVDEMLHH